MRHRTLGEGQARVRVAAAEDLDDAGGAVGILCPGEQAGQALPGADRDQLGGELLAVLAQAPVVVPEIRKEILERVLAQGLIEEVHRRDHAEVVLTRGILQFGATEFDLRPGPVEFVEFGLEHLRYIGSDTRQCDRLLLRRDQVVEFDHVDGNLLFVHKLPDLLEGVVGEDDA